MLRNCRELKEKMEKRPKLPVYFLIYEGASNGDYRYEAPGSIRVDVGEILNTDDPISDEIYTDRERFEIDLWDKIEDINRYCSTQENEKLFEEKLNAYEDDWEEAIIVYLD